MDKKINMWNAISPDGYDSHMGHPDVAQLQMQMCVMKEQFEIIHQDERHSSEIAVLGITNGNGLELVEPMNIGHIIGIDINKDFLETCSQRFGYLGKKLELRQIDLINEKLVAAEVLKNSSLIIANIVIEHIHLENFIQLIESLNEQDRTISCVIQYNPDGSLASTSGFEYVFDDILPMVEEIKKDDLVSAMQSIGYSLSSQKYYVLPNKKVFIRLDFKR